MKCALQWFSQFDSEVKYYLLSRCQSWQVTPSRFCLLLCFRVSKHFIWHSFILLFYIWFKQEQANVFLKCDVCIWRCLTPQASAEDLSIELLFIFADLWGVALRSNVGGVDVHHRALPVGLSNTRLTPAIHWQRDACVSYTDILLTVYWHLYRSVGIRLTLVVSLRTLRWRYLQ